MNKINNQFTSIEQITDRYLGTGKENSTVKNQSVKRTERTAGEWSSKSK